MKKKDENEFKQATVKAIWNISCNLLQEKYYNDYNIIIDPFNRIEFKLRTPKYQI